MKYQGKLYLFGATGGAGFEIARLAIAQGKSVIAIARSTSDVKPLNNLNVDVLTADVMNDSELEKVFAGANTEDVVISALGGKFDEELPADYEGNKNIIDAAKKANLERFVLVTSVGAGESRVALPEQLVPILGSRAELKTKAEDHLRESGLTFTIVRPGHLNDDEKTTSGFLTKDPNTLASISRKSLADIILKIVNLNKTFGLALSAGDTSAIMSDNNPELLTLR